MIEVHSRIFVGNADDYEHQVRGVDGWAVVQACKDPYHREALGYKGRAAEKTHPEYLVARRDDRLILNLVDADNPRFFAKEIFDTALDFIDEGLAAEKNVLVHCNLGESRSPSIGLLYLAARLQVLPTDSLEEAERRFIEIYPAYNPKPGVRGHLRENWAEYVSGAR